MALYSIGTWDADLQAYTPQVGLTVPSFNIDLWTLKRAMKELRAMGYSCHRYYDPDEDNHDDNDWCVLIERTDGEPETEILERWKR